MEYINMKKFFLGLVVMGIVVACSSSSDDDSGQVVDEETFDRGALLANMADNIIIPAFQDLSAKLTTMNTAKDVFVETPNLTTLEALRSSWLAAYRVWQSVEMFDIGEAERIQFRFRMNVYPTNVEDIETNISNGSYDLDAVNNNDAVGFPALDYLLYGVAETDAAIVAIFNNENYSNYLSDVAVQMQTLTTSVLEDWTSTYRNTFVSQSGNTATSALNRFANDYIFYYEKALRANKIGVPAGNFSNTPLPETVEGFYSRVYSKTLALDGMNAVIAAFNGKAYTSDATGESFNTYLESLGNTELATLINTRFTDASARIEALDDDFVNQVNTNNVGMTLAFDALQLAVVSLKVDMLSAFDISVDFIDADGD